MNEFDFGEFGFTADESRENWTKYEDDGSVSNVYYGMTVPMLSNQRSITVCTYVRNYNTVDEYIVIRKEPQLVYNYLLGLDRDKRIDNIIDED